MRRGQQARGARSRYRRRIHVEAVSAILGELPSTFASVLRQIPRAGSAAVRLTNRSFLETRWRHLALKSLHAKGHCEGGASVTGASSDDYPSLTLDVAARPLFLGPRGPSRSRIERRVWITE